MAALRRERDVAAERPSETSDSAEGGSDGATALTSSGQADGENDRRDNARGKHQLRRRVDRITDE